MVEPDDSSRLFTAPILNHGALSELDAEAKAHLMSFDADGRRFIFHNLTLRAHDADDDEAQAIRKAIQALSEIEAAECINRVRQGVSHG